MRSTDLTPEMICLVTPIHFIFFLAYCDLLSHLSCYDWAQKEATRYGDKWAKKWAREPAYMKILAEIPGILENYTKVVDKARFNSWNEYLNEYLSKGILFACPVISSFHFIVLAVYVICCGSSFT